MAYERYKASSVMIKSPQEQYISNYQALVDQQIDNAYNWYDIEVENTFGTQDFLGTKARISYAINPGTGTKLSDDWKQLIFQNPEDNYVKMGRRFRYSDNIWLTVNTEAYGSITENCIVRRCNNTLNFKLANGTIHQEPCAIDNNLKYGNVYFNNAVNVAQGTISVWVQLNNFTKNININDRFIIGYNQVYKVKAVLNYLSDKTFIPDGSPLIQFDMAIDSKLPTDDFVNRITYTTLSDKVGLDSVVKITPDYISITQGSTITYNCYYYIDNVVQPDSFTFTVIGTDVPLENYNLTIIDGNSFSLTNNKKYLVSKLKILCQNTMDSNISMIKEITLGGVY